ncbi:MAG TPA: hypothetical protein VK503_00500, partial [Candidatus Bathyarchaeia archaeon]|nr:hypothetical protein [Candidatus Bathyarchaeia archaeon]
MPELVVSQTADEQIREIGNSRNEPAWLREFRTKSLKLFRDLPIELSTLYTKYADLGGLDLESVATPPPEPKDSEIKQVRDKLESKSAITLYQFESKTLNPS